jgi:hypothetical protein
MMIKKKLICLAFSFFIFGILYASAYALVIGPANITSNDSESIFTINSPTNTLFYSKKVQININSSILGEISYINLDDMNPRWKSLCDDCNEFGFYQNKKLTMNEGSNHLIIRFTTFENNVYEQNVTLRVDSVRPRITSIFPRLNGATNGSYFFIRYSEENLKYITIVYGIDGIKYNATQNCTSGKDQFCFFNINLSVFENQPISYFFKVYDYLDPINSQITKIKVDTIPPVVNIITPKIANHYLKKLPINITISEKARIEYKEDNENNWKTLCTNCDKYGYTDKKYFNLMQGNHELFIRAVDSAGNFEIKEVNFVMD